MVKPRAVDGLLDVLAQPQVTNHGLWFDFFIIFKIGGSIFIIFSIQRLDIVNSKGIEWEYYVNGGCGDSNAAGRSDDQANSTARRVDNDGRRHRRERTFARLDHVGRAGRQTVEIERARRREIGHFVVQDDARLRRSEAGAQTRREIQI